MLLSSRRGVEALPSPTCLVGGRRDKYYTSSVMEISTPPRPLFTLDGYRTWRRHYEVGEGLVSAITVFVLAMDWYDE
jgi:hypothetical protein